MEFKIAEERRRVEAEYRGVLKTSIEFEKRIRNRWREKSRVKSERIAELESRVAELERRLAGVQIQEEVVDRKVKERKLASLMLNDMGMDIGEQEMVGVSEEVEELPDEELDRTLASRLDLPYPVEEEARRGPGEDLVGETIGWLSGGPDMSHEGRPEERES